MHPWPMKPTLTLFHLPCNLEGALAIGGGTEVAMAIVTKPNNEWSPNPRLHTKGAFTLGVRDSSVESIITY